MTDRFDICLPRLLKHEGGWSDHPSDPGGATNLGVTLGALSDWLGRPATKAEVKALTVTRAAPIYKANYWRAAACDKLPAGVDYIVFDLAVNSGVARAKRYLQEALGVRADGVIGPLTLLAVQNTDADELIKRISEKRATFYRGLATFKTFGKGWMRRLDEVTKQALEDAHG